MEKKLTPHPYAEIIKAWADGHEIEAFNGCSWNICNYDPTGFGIDGGEGLTFSV